MLSAAARGWPAGRDWVLQPKWDGFRVLVEVDANGRVRGWSRHGTSLTARVGPLLAVFDGVASGTTFDGELVAVSEREGQATQDFAAVARAVFGGAPAAAAAHLRFVAFDLLSVAGEDIRARSWRERDAQLRDILPVSDRIRMVSSQTATPAAHDAIVALGFEGTVLKRPGSAYRAGRHRAWVKHKARLSTNAEVRSVHQDRDGQWRVICHVGDRRVHAVAGPDAAELIGERVQLVYSRVDANGTLREARIGRGALSTTETFGAA